MRCPDCRAGWNEEFLTKSLTGVFRAGPLKTHRGKVLLDAERIRLPDTQDRARSYSAAKEFVVTLDVPIAKLRTKINSIHKKQNALQGDAAQDKYILIMQADTLKIELDALLLTWREAFVTMSRFGRVDDTDVIASKPRVYIRKCPQDKCEGFLNEEFKCGLCDIQTCKDCQEVIGGAGHVCDASTLITIKAIKKEARPCPICAALISKIDGCDQMWCTQCKTAFSWNTGAVETIVIHNPHYYQWMRATGQTIPLRGDVVVAAGPCTLEAIIHKLRDLGDQANTGNDICWKLIENCRQLLNNRYANVNVTRRIDNYMEDEWRARLRVRRLVGELKDDEWALILAKEEHLYHINRAWQQLVDVHIQTGTTIIGQILTGTDVLEVRRQYTEFQTFCSEAATKICRTYKCGGAGYHW